MSISIKPDRIRALLPALAPSAAIIAVWIFGIGSGSAQTPGPVDVEPVEMTPAISIKVPERDRPARDVERAAAARAAALRAEFAFPSPFRIPERSHQERAEEVRLQLPPGIELTSLMNTGGRAIAVIDGRPYRVGDRLEDVATIDTIDVNGRRVILALDNGTKAELKLE